MKDCDKELIDEFSKKLIDETFLFLVEKIDRKESNSYFIDLILSAHLSSAFSLMQGIADGDKEMENRVDAFIKSILNHISQLPMIKEIGRFKGN